MKMMQEIEVKLHANVEGIMLSNCFLQCKKVLTREDFVPMANELCTVLTFKALIKAF